MNRTSLAAIFATAFLFAPAAHAYCRTTTCDPNADDCRLNADGCVRDGVPLVWKASPIVYRFFGPGSSKLEDKGARAAIRRAFDTWTNAECKYGRTSIRFEEGPDVNDDKPVNSKQASEKFGIYFRDDEWPHDDPNESLALTNQVYGKTSGTIDYADIEINTVGFKFALTDAEKGADLQAVITHEVGHYIGLAHSTDPDSIMVARYCQNEDLRCGKSIDQSRALADDDVQAVCAAYPPTSASETPQPTQGCTQAQAKHKGLADAFAVLGLVFAVAAVVRRRWQSS